jgi:hypothetical protein
LSIILSKVEGEIDKSSMTCLRKINRVSFTAGSRRAMVPACRERELDLVDEGM